MGKNFHQDEINKLINSAWNTGDSLSVTNLREKYNAKLEELGISSNQAEKNLQIEYRTLNALLDGNLQRFDLLSLLKLANFLMIPEYELIEIYIKFVSEKYKEDIDEAKKRIFILHHFDLTILKKIGVIETIQDFQHIENSLTRVFDINHIDEYNIEDTGAALSSTKINVKNEKSRTFFKNKAKRIFELIKNPYPFNKQAVVDYFPKIRWHSTDIESGIVNVIRSLFELGVTIIFQPKIPSLQLRGATFEVNGKPCIVLTDYRNSYPTLWFALLHELFHVLFDWNEILQKKYHISDEENDILVIREKEEEANEFAREYLFPSKKFDLIGKNIRNKSFVRHFAIEHHVHPSIIYANYCFIHSSIENNYWMEFDKLIRPSIEGLLQKLRNDLDHKSSASEYAKYYRSNIFKIDNHE